MPSFNIHWKGYPHHRLPRIRAASTRSTSRTSVRSRSVPRIAAANSIRRPLGAELGRERKKQRFALRRRRSRKSRSSSSAARARKYASLKTRQHIQVFGWDAGIDSKANTVKTESVPSSIQARAGSRPPVPPRAPQDSISQTTIIDSHDGAGSSACRRLKPTQPEKVYSLMHIAEVPVYWSSKKPANRSIASSQALTRTRRVGEYAHVGPLDPVSRRSTYRRPQRVGRSRTYDPRIDPRSLIDRERPTKSVPNNPTATTRRTVSRPSAYKPSLGSPGLQRILKSKVSKEAKKSPQSVTPSMKSIVQTLLSDSTSRTPSQRKALKQFTKELELYLQAARAVPKHSLVPSPSATTVSAHTIEELRPYQSEFRSAGLAVTSADQRRESSIMAKLKKSSSSSSSPPPTPPKDGKYNQRKSMAGKSKMSSGGYKEQEMDRPRHHHKTGSLPSFDSETTVMDFTPPHEQIGSRAARGRRRSSLSSDHTIMAFTPPHEVPPSQAKSAPPPPSPLRASTKRSLPWLRKPRTPEESPSPRTNDKNVVTSSTATSKTRNPSDVLLSFPVARNSAVLNRRDSDVKWQDTNYGTESAASNVTKKRKGYSDAAIQAPPELSDDFTLTGQCVQYTDATTQIDARDIGSSNNCRSKSIEHLPPLIKHKSKTFPTSPNKCAGNCSRPTPGASGARSFRKTYKDQETQTDTLEKCPDVNQASAHESKRPSFKSNPQTPDPNGTFPFASPSPFQRPQAPTSPNKSVDEVAGRRTRARNDPLDTIMPAPKATSRLSICPNQLPLRCTHCSAEIKPSTIEWPQRIATEPEPQTEPEPEPQPEIELQSPPRSGLSHTCTARSSLECQQCAPRDTASLVSQRGDLSALFTQSPQPKSRHSPYRSPAQATVWAATLEADLEEVIKGYHSPEERLMQREVIADTMAEYSKQPPVSDPVKRPSVPKFRLRPVPATRVPQKRSLFRQTDRLPSAPPSPDTVIPQSETITTSTSLTRDDVGISNRAVFRGLHVATAAACDGDMAKWIEEITGTGVRQFLADLSAFDGLGVNTLAGVAKRAAKQRRGEVKAWEKVREKRLQEREFERGCEDCVVDGRKQGGRKDGKMGFMDDDETVNSRAERSARDKSGEEVLDDMIKARECRSREGLRERAVKMGWRDRSVSGDV